MPTPFHYRHATYLLRRGGIVAHPTEAVYGLACNPLDPRAVYRLLELKRRLVEKGLILIAADYGQLAPFITWREKELPEAVRTGWPGPRTWLLPAAPHLPTWITGGRDRVAVRVTAHPVAAELCRRFGRPLISTSANRSGLPPARNPLQVRLRCPGADLVLHGPTGGLENPTPIRDATTGEVLRP